MGKGGRAREGGRERGEGGRGGRDIGELTLKNIIQCFQFDIIELASRGRREGAPPAAASESGEAGASARPRASAAGGSCSSS